MKYDFGGYATRNDLLCSDKRIIRRDAFKECDGMKVPLVWNHDHESPEGILGYALLENRPDGVYCNCSFNNSPMGKVAKEAVQHGDVTSLSIYANRLQQNGPNVTHGVIREVSLVLAGANPGATIIDYGIEHSDGNVEKFSDEAFIFAMQPIDAGACVHSDADDEEDKDAEEESEAIQNESSDDCPIVSESTSSKDSTKDEDEIENKEKKENNMANEPKDEVEDNKAADSSDVDEKTFGEIYDGMTDEQKMLIQFLVGLVMEKIQGGEASGDEMAQSEFNSEDDDSMYHNVFENDSAALQHAEEIRNEIFTSGMESARRGGSFRDAVIEHAAKYGIENVNVLFPDAQMDSDSPHFLERQQDWVTKVLNGTTHVPFSRIKSVVADITADEARAKGYIKGKEKVSEFFKVAKRETTPQTVYKKQKLDRDDVLDITDFNVVNWLRTEMRRMLNEELALSFILGDGRDDSSEEKISEDHIRPVVSDNDLFCVKNNLSQKKDIAKVVEEIALGHMYYRGSGEPVFFTSPSMHTKMLWVKDTVGRRIYSSDEELCAALRVTEIIEIPQMESKTVEDDSKTYEVIGVKVALPDYKVGADKGGEINDFEDFDIDFNQHKYLMETRCSGALTVPMAAQTIRFCTSEVPSAQTFSAGKLDTIEK